jgi:5-methylcytosine-specific restriction enzyme A
MSPDPDLKRGQVVNNDQLCALFKCSPQGGMRRSLKTNSLVLVSNHVASIYDDRWIGDVFHYTGMGQLGDQTLTGSQNKTLSESQLNGVNVYLFEVDRETEYRYQGPVELAANPYQEVQPDQAQQDRKVWVFPLRLKEGKPVPLDTAEFAAAELTRYRKARKLTNAELVEKAEKAPRQAGERTVTSKQYERNPYVSMLTKRYANGFCELCGVAAPFTDANGQPYLETHHIDWLARGGHDTLANTVALCPNCHRKMHVVDAQEDKAKLRNKIKQRPSDQGQ